MRVCNIGIFSNRVMREICKIVVNISGAIRCLFLNELQIQPSFGAVDRFDENPNRFDP